MRKQMWAKGPRFLILIVLALQIPMICSCNQEPATRESPRFSADFGKPAFQSKWEQLIKEARHEGEVAVVLGSTHSRNRRPIFAKFTEKFDVKVISTTGSGPSNTQRVLAERSRNQFAADISMLGSISSERLRESGAFSPLMPLFIHPEVIDRSQGWRIQDHVWYGSEPGFMAAYALSVHENVSDIYYNKNKVSQEEIDSLQSWHDFLKPQWKSRVVSILDPDSPEGHLTLPWDVLGREWFDRFIREMAPTLLPAHSPRALTDGLARGKYDVAFLVTAAAETDLDQMARIGLPVVKLERTLAQGSGVYTGWSIAVFDRAPHPKAAQLFINWYLSREGQNLLHKLSPMGSNASMRSDVEQGNVPNETWDYLKSLKPGSIKPRGTRQRMADMEEASAFMREICNELGCYGY